MVASYCAAVLELPSRRSSCPASRDALARRSAAAVVAPLGIAEARTDVPNLSNAWLACRSSAVTHLRAPWQADDLAWNVDRVPLSVPYEAWTWAMALFLVAVVPTAEPSTTMITPTEP